VKGVILSLCDDSGLWPQPYAEAGYDVRQIDIQNGHDVRLLEHLDTPVRGILAAPPRTAFSVSGAQYWPAKDADGTTLAALATVDACLRAVAIYNPAWWAMENPVGRLRRWLGPPVMWFNPCDFGGWLRPDDRPHFPRDAYTKRTGLWGRFTPPTAKPVEPVRVCGQGSWLMQLGGKSARTKRLRSMTPLGFARAFADANP